MKTIFTSTNFFNAINSDFSLAQIFVVILFFENYLIYIENSSLLNISIDLGNLKPAPFVLFFIFITVAKIGWQFCSHILDSLKDRIGQPQHGVLVSKKVHFTVFLLFVLSSVYMFNNYEKFSNPGETILSQICLTLAGFTTMVTAFLFYMAKIGYALDDEVKIREY